jgi:D-threonate/D-erythronate kinase
MRLRLVADDLTGALDTSVRFVPLCGPVTCIWDGSAPPTDGGLAIDLGTRDLEAAEAEPRHRRGAAVLVDGDPGYLKIDSLLRGHPVTSILACLSAGRFDHAVIAPAFPAQGRVTRGGRQMWQPPNTGRRQPVGPDLPLLLAGAGQRPALLRPGSAATPGISVWDAETEADLALIVQAGRALPGRVLWCGSAGLAASLAGGPSPAHRTIIPPLLALIGTDHPVTASQLRAAARWHLPVREVTPDALDAMERRLAADHALLITAELPDGIARPDAAAYIEAMFAGIVRSLAASPPGTLLACGGETLRGVCTSLGARALQVAAEFAPGVPVSRLVGGAWDGLPVISKSGAFGRADLLAEIVRLARL